jgi:hypothetical protein
MGLPTTWFLLNLSHLFWIDETANSAERSLRKAIRYGTAICGDDLVAVWPKE